SVGGATFQHGTDGRDECREHLIVAVAQNQFMEQDVCIQEVLRGALPGLTKFTHLGGKLLETGTFCITGMQCNTAGGDRLNSDTELGERLELSLTLPFIIETPSDDGLVKDSPFV